MALLENGLSGEASLLRARHVLGRDPQRCDTVIADPYVSRIHASICWTAGRWELHDHGRNGTFVSGRFVGEGECVVLRDGDLIQFGSAGSVRWRARELGEPVDMLWPLRAPRGRSRSIARTRCRAPRSPSAAPHRATGSATTRRPRACCMTATR